MLHHENLTNFMGHPVKDWAETPADQKDFKRVIFRLRVGYDDETTVANQFAELLETAGSEQIESLVIGAWHGADSSAEPTEIYEALVAARDRLPRLRNLFLGDIVSEENEISWIQQTDLTPLLLAFDKLERLIVRGGNGLSFGGALAHQNLKQLIVQAGGLPPTVVHEVAAAQVPSLEHLELWLGEPNYGGDATIEDLSPFLWSSLFPKMRYLGLKNSVIQDEIAGVAAMAPVLARLEVLDLSMGTLSDDGGRALFASTPVRKLKKLDLHHHFISEAVQQQLNTLGIEVDLSDPQEPQSWGGEQHRFISVSE